ncbi:peptide-methionine (R)-S-oxide reductase MsrB [Alphaproteobacteria bacterium]|nr:peptide-methionine (R)-S-oxide reductase MsrB [Alphaproteobacteria bacterium]
MKKILKTDSEWRKILTEEEFLITRKKGTEAPFSGKEYNIINEGSFKCKCCDADLFNSNSKYDSGCGWPSFFEQISPEAIKKKTDYSHGMLRIEIMCAQCDSHLGHIFDDGPKPTGQRYCVNSLSIKYKELE